MARCLGPMEVMGDTQVPRSKYPRPFSYISCVVHVENQHFVPTASALNEKGVNQFEFGERTFLPITRLGNVHFYPSRDMHLCRSSLKSPTPAIDFDTATKPTHLADFCKGAEPCEKLF